MTNPPVVLTNEPTVPTSTPRFTETWIALDRWCATMGVPGPKLIHANASRTYLLPAADGVAALTAGQRVASWGGLEFWLGYAPRVTNQTLFVHADDAQKTLLPLLQLTKCPAMDNRCIVIDPGHGGRSPGTSNIVTGVYEKQYTLDWARRLQAILVSHGWKAILTRSNDIEISLSNRVAFAEQSRASLFVSLHFNSSDVQADPRHERRGLQTFCLTPAGLPSSLIRDPENDLQTVFPNNRYDSGNFQYALKFHQSLLRVTGLRDLGVQRARFMGVLRGHNRPAVLIEGGFLSNPQEARLIADPNFRQKLAAAVARVLLP